MKRIMQLIASSLIILLTACHNLPGNAQQELPATSAIVDQTVPIYAGTGLTEATNCCDTATHSDDKSFIYGRCIRLPRLTGESSTLARINNLIAADYKSFIELCGKEIPDQENFLKADYQYFLADSLLSLVIEVQNAWHLSEGTSEYKVYHFDLKNNQLLDTRAMLESWGMSQVPILNAIAEQLTMPPDHTDPLFQQAWFDNIKWKDINQLKIYKNNNKQLVVIYPVVENGLEAAQIIE
jgi:hypothetical protein